MDNKVRRRRKTSAYQRQVRFITSLGYLAVVLIVIRVFWKMGH